MPRLLASIGNIELLLGDAHAARTLLLGSARAARAFQVLDIDEDLAGEFRWFDADQSGAARRLCYKLRGVVVGELRHAAPRRDGVRLVVLLLEARSHRKRERRAELRRGPPEHARVAGGLASYNSCLLYTSDAADE